MPTLHVVVTKEFTFRGQPERWSNGYDFQTGGAAIDAALCANVARAVRDMEKVWTSNQCKFPYLVAGPLGEDALFAEELGAAGPVGLDGTVVRHPELCVLAQSKIAPKRYLMKYYHAASGIGASGDAIVGAGQTAMNAALVKLTDGTLPSAVVLCRPNGALATAPMTCDPFVRVHQLKRRGRRP